MKNISYYIGTCFQPLFSDTSAPEWKMFNKMEEPLEKDKMPLHPFNLKLDL
jgi:hypothetical protein